MRIDVSSQASIHNRGATVCMGGCDCNPFSGNGSTSGNPSPDLFYSRLVKANYIKSQQDYPRGVISIRPGEGPHIEIIVSAQHARCSSNEPRHLTAHCGRDNHARDSPHTACRCCEMTVS